MQRARAWGIPFWPATSVLEMPTIVHEWQSVATAAEERARPTLERRARQRAKHEAAMSGNNANAAY